MGKQLKRNLMDGPGTLSPAADRVGGRAKGGTHSARGPPLLADYLSEHDAAPQLGQKVRTLRLWRQQGVGPAWIKVGRRVMYARATILAWLQSLERKPVRAGAGK